MRSLKVSGIIHLFAVLHAVVALSCHLAGINDELVLTLLTIVLIVLICLKRGLNVEFTAASVIVVNVIGYLLGTGGAQLIELLLHAPPVVACRLDLHHHRDPGLEHRVVHQVVPPRRRHGEPLLGLDAPHRVAAAGRGGGIFVLRLAYVELFASPSFSTDRLYHMADLLASNSAALIILLCVNIIYVRHTRRRETRHGPIAEIAAFLLFVLLTSACVALITGLHLPFAFDRSFTAREFLQLWIVTLLVEVTLYSVVFMVDYALVARAVLRAERGKAHQAQFRYMKLKQQVNPHFLFNSLNILDCLVCEQRTEQASAYIHKLAGIYRYMLQNEEETLVRLREEMAFVGMYVDLLQVRFPEGFRVETDISDEAMNRHVLPCSVQLLIENAIKHNSVGADRPLVIRIVAVAEAVTVSNNLQLKVSGNPSTRVGLNYIRQQYLDLSGIPIGIRRTDTEYCVTLPLL